MGAEKSFYRWDKEILYLKVLGKPSSKKDELGSIINGEIKIHIKAIPEKGKASEHLIAFLASIFGVSKSNIEMLYGEFSTHKQFKIYQPKRLPTVIKKAEE